MALPDILYKYRSLDPGSREYTLRTISLREIWFSSLSQFNDPFEARVSVSMDGDDEAWHREFRCSRPSEDKLLAIVAELEQGVRQDAQKIGMFCLSAKPDDILMWSYYACSHRGLCLGFRTTNASILWDAQPIEYSSEYPLVDYFRMTREQRVRTMLLRKAKHWEHEQEWRALRTGPKPGLACHPIGMLASIILGSEITPSDRGAVVGAAMALPVRPDIYQARRSQSAFALDLCRIDNPAG